MGLCKCPQRKVSTLFCFKHHVNVCESCLVADHAQCVIRSYFSWLQDKDYNPNCVLCQRSLTETGEETIRLTCYDLFHWSCLNEYFQSFPNHTAPDGYTCPICQVCVFPPTNLVSPVADQVRAKLAQVNWANRLPVLSSNDSSISHEKQPLLTETENNGYVIVNPTASNVSTPRLPVTSGLTHNPHRAIDMSQGPIIPTTRPAQLDSDEEDKYKRRSVMTWFARWLRSRQPTNRKGILYPSRTSTPSSRYTIYLIFFVLFILVTIITVLYHLTRGENNDYMNLQNDPQFDPLNNPFIRVGGRLVKSSLKDSNLPIEKVQPE